MARKGKSKGRKSRAASASTSTERASEGSEAVSSEAVSSGAVSGASSLVGDEDDRSSLGAMPAVDDVQGNEGGDVKVETIGRTSEVERSGEDEDPAADNAVQDAEATTEAVGDVEASEADAGAATGSSDVVTAVVDAQLEEEQGVVEQFGADKRGIESTQEEAAVEQPRAVENDVTEEVVTEKVAVEEQHIVAGSEWVEEASAAEVNGHFTTDATTEEAAKDEQYAEASTMQDEQFEDQIQAENPVAEEIASEERRHTNSAPTEEFAVTEQQEEEETGATDEDVIVQESQTETVGAEDGGVVETHAATAVAKDLSAEEVHTETAADHDDAGQAASANSYALEPAHSESVIAEEELVTEANETNEAVAVESVTADSIETDEAETIPTEQMVVDQQTLEAVERKQTPDEATVVAEEEEDDAIIQDAETVVTEKIAAFEEQHSETVETEEIVAAEVHRDEMVVEKVEDPVMELHQPASLTVESSGEQQSVDAVESATDATAATASGDVDVSDKVESTAPADSADRKTWSRPMLTTERSFVMESDNTVKAEDTVVVSERMSTDGEDDFEDATPQPSEGFQAAVIANSMSSMLGKQHSKTLQRRSSATAPTASSAARRSSEDLTPTVTPPRVRSRSRSGSRQSTPDTGFVKPAPAPPTVPVPPKRASIMAPTASYVAKHQVEEPRKKTPTRARSQSTEAKPEISDTGFIKPPPAPPTVPIAPKRASIMAPTASYAAKHQVEDAPRKTPPRPRADKHAKPEISDTGFIKPPPAPPTVPIAPKRASIMAPTASSSAKRGQEAAAAAVEAKAPHRVRRSPGVKPEVSDTGFVKPPPPPPTVPIAPKRASIMAPTASSAAKRGGGSDAAVDDWSRDAPPKPTAKTKTAEFVPTVPVAPKRASIMAPTASFRAKSGPDVVVEDLPPPPVETKLYRNKRYANVQSKVRDMVNKPTEPKPSTATPVVEKPKPVQKPTLFKSKRYANVQSKIKATILAGPSQPDPSAVERRRSLGGAKHDTAADTGRRRSSLIGTLTQRSKVSGSGSGSSSDSDPFAQALAARTHKKKLSNAVPRYLSYESSGVFAQRAQVQQERRRRLEEQNASKSQTRQHQLRVEFAEKLHVNYNAQEAEHSQAALGNVGARARRGGGGGSGKTRGSRSSSASDEFSASNEPKPAPVAVAGGVFVLPSVSASGSNSETAGDASEAVAKAATGADAASKTVVGDGVTKKINFDDTSDDEEEEVAVPVADVA